MVKYDRISHKTLQAFLDLINATIIDHLKILKDWFLIPWLIKMILICLLSPNDKKLPGKFKMKHIMKLLEHVMLPRSVLPSLCHSITFWSSSSSTAQQLLLTFNSNLKYVCFLWIYRLRWIWFQSDVFWQSYAS